MKEKNNKILYAITAIVIAVLLIGGIYFITGKQSQSTSTRETNNTNKDVSIEDFKKALNERGLTITSENAKAGTLIGATEGYGYTINDGTIEIYKFDEKSSNDLTKSNIKSAKEKGIVTMPSFNNVTLNAKYNKGLVLISYDEHPDKDKILEIFNNL